MKAYNVLQCTSQVDIVGISDTWLLLKNNKNIIIFRFGKRKFSTILNIGGYIFSKIIKQAGQAMEKAMCCGLRRLVFIKGEHKSI